MVGLAEEFRDTILVDEVLYPMGKFLSVVHLTGFVEHSHDEFLVIRCSDHRAIHVLFAFL